MTAYGYIRKSVVHDAARMLSPEMQEKAIHDLAARHGDTNVVILSDLDVSGKKDRTRRPGWNELLKAVESGDATAVYAYSLSRFARSVAQLADFFDLCERLKVPVRVEVDKIDTKTASGKLVGNVLASLAQFESDVASERVKDAFAAKRSRDATWIGPGNRPYGDDAGEDASVVVAAFRESGSYDRAARLLNERGIPTRKEGAIWHGTTVKAIVQRVAPDEVLPDGRRGAKAGKRDFRLAFLLICPVCGGHLTASMDKRRNEVRYYCHRAIDGKHPRTWVSESALLPLVDAEMMHADVIIKRKQVGNAGDQAKVAALGQKRGRILDMYQDGLIDKAERDRRLVDVTNAESKLTALRWIRTIGAFRPIITDRVNEDGSVTPASEPDKVNTYLRRLLFGVVVRNMTTPAKRGPSHETWDLEFQWRDPSMRVDGDEDAA